MSKAHRYVVTNRWTGNLGSGTLAYTAYSRNHELNGVGKSAPVPCSSDPAFRGDASRYNPEELLVGALSGFPIPSRCIIGRTNYASSRSVNFPVECESVVTAS